MEFFNKLGNIASETYKKTSKRTGDLAKEAKIKMKINEDKGKIKDLYAEIGKFIYQKHIENEDVSNYEEVIGFCKQIDEISEGIENSLTEVRFLKGKRLCEKCSTEIDLNVKFCPECGAEQPEIPVEEAVEPEVLENEEIAGDSNTEDEEVKEEEKVKDEDKKE